MSAATTGLSVVATTTDDRALAERIARAAIEKRLAACARIREADSVYRWEGEIRSEREFVLELKTTDAALGAVEALIKQLHSYELPEIVVHPISGGSKDYLAWVSAETGAGS